MVFGLYNSSNPIPWCLMSFLSLILSKMSSLSTPHRTFLVGLLGAFCCFVGRATRTNLHRYGAPSPRTQHRWAGGKQAMDWTAFNLQLLQEVKPHTQELQAVAIDATFVPKSGKKTFGLGTFWDGCQSRARKGLEVSLLALVEADGERAWALNALQTPAELKDKLNRCTHYLSHLRQERPHLPASVRHVLADGLYANQAFVWGVLDLDLHLVSKLRRNANLRYLYTGPQKGRGRPRQYDVKVDFEDWSRWEPLESGSAGLQGFTAVVNHPDLRQNLRVVVLFPTGQPKKRRVLMSTDVALSGAQVVSLYASRFQIEFLFRDAKQFTGLTDGQSRDAKGLHFHLNASFAALNLLRAEHLLEHTNHTQTPVSIDSLKRRHFNELILRRLFFQLGLDPSSEKIQPVFDEVRQLGCLAA